MACVVNGNGLVPPSKELPREEYGYHSIFMLMPAVLIVGAPNGHAMTVVGKDHANRNGQTAMAPTDLTDQCNYTPSARLVMVPASGDKQTNE